MSTIIRHSDTCQVKQTSSNRIADAVVQDFREHETLTVILNKSVKMVMKWNGKCYEGRMAGMDFTSVGPSITKTQTSSRG
jgi:hypothetical protein